MLTDLVFPPEGVPSFEIHYPSEGDKIRYTKAGNQVMAVYSYKMDGKRSTNIYEWTGRYWKFLRKQEAK